MEGIPTIDSSIGQSDPDTIETTGPTPEQVTVHADQEQIDFRNKQEFSSRLAEYITGLRPDDPKMVERLTEDQKIIRAKYNLPAIETITSLTAYERFLRNVAEELGVEIKPTSDCGDFFKKNPITKAVNIGDEKKIGIDIDRSTRDEYRFSLTVLEHELIHAKQDKVSPNMPIELKEYEAYVSRGNMEYLKTNQRAVELLFGFLIGGSVSNWYSRMSKSAGSEVEPAWDNADYFLKKSMV